MRRATSSPFAPVRSAPCSGAGDESPLRGGEHAHRHRNDGGSPVASSAIGNSKLGAGTALGAGRKTSAGSVGGNRIRGWTAAGRGAARSLGQSGGGGSGSASGKVLARSRAAPARVGSRHWPRDQFGAGQFR